MTHHTDNSILRSPELSLTVLEEPISFLNTYLSYLSPDCGYSRLRKTAFSLISFRVIFVSGTRFSKQRSGVEWSGERREGGGGAPRDPRTDQEQRILCMYNLGKYSTTIPKVPT